MDDILKHLEPMDADEAATVMGEGELPEMEPLPLDNPETVFVEKGAVDGVQP